MTDMQPAQRSSPVSDLFREEAAAWGVSLRTAVALFVLPASGLLLGVLVLAWRPAATFLLAEDSVFEWATAAALATVVVLAIGLGRALWRKGNKAAAGAYALAAVGGLVAAGEEISWGQRLLSLDTPAPLRDINLQEELTVHNLEAVYPLYLVALLAVGLYGSVGTWLVYAVLRRRGERWMLFVPPLFLSSAFLQLAAYRIVRVTGTEGYRYGEWCELCVAVALAVFVALNLGRQRATRDAFGPLALDTRASPRPTMVD
jgi:hypothetical protein